MGGVQNTPALYYEGDFPSEYGQADKLVGDVLQAMEDRGWSSREIFAVNMALVEAINNAIEHGNNFEPQKRFTFACQFKDDSLISSVKDEGPGFCEDLIPDPRNMDRLEIPTGRGLLLINEFMDSVWFNEQRNEIHMKKDRQVAG